jgi:hypothetical protein
LKVAGTATLGTIAAPQDVFGADATIRMRDTDADANRFWKITVNRIGTGEQDLFFSSAQGGGYTTYWSMSNTSGDLLPGSDNGPNLGSVAATVDTGFFRDLRGPLSATKNSQGGITATFTDAASPKLAGGLNAAVTSFTITGGNPDDNHSFFASYWCSSNLTAIHYSDGDWQNHDNSYGAISDSAVKQNITDAPDAAEFVKNLKIHEFEYKDTPGEKHLGVAAQELQEIAPELVSRCTVPIDSMITDSTGKQINVTVRDTTLLGVNYMGLLVKALPITQSNTERIEALEKATGDESFGGLPIGQVVAGLVVAVAGILAWNTKQKQQINALEARIAKLEGKDPEPPNPDEPPA